MVYGYGTVGRANWTGVIALGTRGGYTGALSWHRGNRIGAYSKGLDGWAGVEVTGDVYWVLG